MSNVTDVCAYAVPVASANSSIAISSAGRWSTPPDSQAQRELRNSFARLGSESGSAASNFERLCRENERSLLGRVFWGSSQPGIDPPRVPRTPELRRNVPVVPPLDLLAMLGANVANACERTMSHEKGSEHCAATLAPAESSAAGELSSIIGNGPKLAGDKLTNNVHGADSLQLLAHENKGMFDLFGDKVASSEHPIGEAHGVCGQIPDFHVPTMSAGPENPGPLFPQNAGMIPSWGDSMRHEAESGVLAPLFNRFEGGFQRVGGLPSSWTGENRPGGDVGGPPAGSRIWFDGTHYRFEDGLIVLPGDQPHVAFVKQFMMIGGEEYNHLRMCESQAELAVDVIQRLEHENKNIKDEFQYRLQVEVDKVSHEAMEMLNKRERNHKHELSCANDALQKLCKEASEAMTRLELENRALRNSKVQTFNIGDDDHHDYASMSSSHKTKAVSSGGNVQIHSGGSRNLKTVLSKYFPSSPRWLSSSLPSVFSGVAGRGNEHSRLDAVGKVSSSVNAPSSSSADVNPASASQAPPPRRADTLHVVKETIDEGEASRQSNAAPSHFAPSGHETTGGRQEHEAREEPQNGAVSSKRSKRRDDPDPSSSDSESSLSSDESKKRKKKKKKSRRSRRRDDGSSVSSDGDQDLPMDERVKREKRKLRRARTENFEVPPLPKPERLPDWKVDVYDRVSTAFTHAPDIAFEWVSATDQATKLEDLDENELPTLDAKLLLALRKVAHTDANVQKDWNLHTKRFQKDSKKIRARQLLFLLYEHLKPRVMGKSVYEMADLMGVKFGCDPKKGTIDHLIDFQFRWKKCLLDISFEAPEPMLHTLYLKQIKGVPCLTYDMNVYDDMDEDQKTYTWLFKRVETIIERTKRDRNQDRIHNDMKGDGRNTPRPAGPATTHSPRGRTPSPHRTRSSSPRGGRSPRRSMSKSRSPGGRRKCYAFAKTGKCPDGDKCKYSHSKAKGRSPSRSPGRASPNRRTRSDSPRRNIPCNFWKKDGTCKFGDKCRFSHTNDRGPASPDRRNAAPATSAARTDNSPAPTSGEQGFP